MEKSRYDNFTYCVGIRDSYECNGEAERANKHRDGVQPAFCCKGTRPTLKGLKLCTKQG